MSPVEWFYARGNSQMGPVSAAELKRLAGAGELAPDDLVWREGLAEWTPARNVRGLFDEEVKSAVVEETAAKPVVASSKGGRPEQQAAAPPVPAQHPIDLLLDSLRGDFNVRCIETTSKMFRACGLYGLLPAMLLVAVFAALTASKTDALENLVSGVLLLVLLGAMQYAAGKSCDAADRLNRAGGVGLPSATLPDCLAVLGLAAGLTALFGSVPAAVSASTYSLILVGVVGFIVWVFLAMVALNPSTLNVSISADDCRASEESLGLLTFLLKALLRVVPVAFGAGVIAGALMLGHACYEALSGPDSLPSARTTAAVARTVLIYSAALPLAAYLAFLLASLVLDLWRTILSLPAKLDKSADKKNDE